MVTRDQVGAAKDQNKVFYVDLPLIRKPAGER